MQYEFGDVVKCTVGDKGVHITWTTGRKESRFIPYDKIVSVSVKKPGLMTAGHIFFQTAADGNNPLMSTNTVPFRGKENYRLACEIQKAVENRIS